ncbi:carboxypeptidase regulatory-like domain-containing protein [Patescibacteria group bacterium]|nr:MAG: carboxypeptidase regulatory-like domain-containing protein [Patescibacteria group bacterium]
MYQSRYFSSILFFLVFALSFPFLVFASTTNGTIDSTYKYAEALDDNFGTINFGLSAGDVHVTDSALTGYAWGENIGWINLAPTNSGVTNNSEGTLGGYAWGEKVGWINFAPTGGGVTINSSGDFLGYAWSDTIGWILFNCNTNSSCGVNDFKVKTDWRPASSRSSGSGGGNGGFSAPTTSSDPAPAPAPAETTAPPVPPAEAPAPDAPAETATTPAPPAPAPSDSGVTASDSSSGSSGESNGGSGGGSSFVGPVLNLAESVKEQIQESFTVAKEITGQVVTDTKRIVQSPVGSVVTKTVSTVGVVSTGAVAAASSLFLNPLSFSELFLIPLRLWALLMTTFGLKKRNRPWGTVYDSVTKQPLDPAYVVLQDLQGNEVNTAITDLDGRYGFLLFPGKYTIVANKTNYIFPSKKLAGKTQDELYQDLYFGEELDVSTEGAIITKNIPLDPEHFDWNEFAKGNQKLMLFYSRRDKIMKKISSVSFSVGLVVALIALLAAPQPYNIGIFAVYCVLLVIRILGVKQKSHGSVIEKGTGLPLAFAIVRVFSIDLNRELFSRVTDKFGRYYCLVPKGKYTISIEKKNLDESYTPVYTSPEIDASKGVISEAVTV